MGELLNDIKGNFVDIYIPSNILGKYSINKFMQFFDGHAKKLEPQIYDETNFIDPDEVNTSNFIGELNILNIANDYIDSLNYDDDFKSRIKKSVQELYKETLTPEYQV